MTSRTLAFGLCSARCCPGHRDSNGALAVRTPVQTHGRSSSRTAHELAATTFTRTPNAPSVRALNARSKQHELAREAFGRFHRTSNTRSNAYELDHLTSHSVVAFSNARSNGREVCRSETDESQNSNNRSDHRELDGSRPLITRLKRPFEHSLTRQPYKRSAYTRAIRTGVRSRTNCASTHRPVHGESNRCSNIARSSVHEWRGVIAIRTRVRNRSSRSRVLSAAFTSQVRGGMAIRTHVRMLPRLHSASAHVLASLDG